MTSEAAKSHFKLKKTQYPDKIENYLPRSLKIIYLSFSFLTLSAQFSILLAFPLKQYGNA
jgi:hypothetical protein